MDIEIIRLEQSHIPDMVTLEVTCFSTPWSENLITQELRQPYAYYWGAVVDGCLVGYAGLNVILEEGHITNVAVDPEARRKGIGAALMSTLVAFAKEHTLAFLTLEVREGNNAAIRLYEQFGFLRCGVRPDYYELPKEAALLMTLFFPMEDL